MSKPRLLCLHGGGSNNDITAFQTQGLRLSARFDIVFLHAPHAIGRCYPGLNQFSLGPWYAWADPTRALSDQEEQWDESLEYLAKFCEEHGPFDGAYGFSQGTAALTNFSHPKVWKERFGMKRCPWKFAILACGGASQYVTLQRATDIVDLPSFHIFGKRDRIMADSLKIAEYWSRSRRTSCTHKRGHAIDMQMCNRETELMAKLDDFLDEQISLKKEGIFSKFSMPEFHLLGYSFGRDGSDPTVSDQS